MSPLTKALVVVVTILAVLLVALVVPFVAQTQDFRGQLQQAQGQMQAARQRATTLEAEMQAQAGQESARVQALNQQISELSATISELQSQVGQARLTQAGSEAELTEAKANLARLTATSENAIRLMEAQTQELQEARQQLVQTSQRLVEQTDVNNALAAQLASLERQVRLIREEGTTKDERIRALESGIAGLPQNLRDQILGGGQARGSEIAPVPLSPIVGQITNVQQAGETTLVQVNVGRADGVQRNMRFMVHRQGQYLGEIVIETVDESQAAGSTVIQTGQLQSGDEIFAGSSSLSSSSF